MKILIYLDYQKSIKKNKIKIIIIFKIKNLIYLKSP